MVPAVESCGSKSFVEEAVIEAEDRSSPLSTSPSAKMIKIEEIADAPSRSPEQYAAQFSNWLKPSEKFNLVFFHFMLVIFKTLRAVLFLGIWFLFFSHSKLFVSVPQTPG